VVRRGAEDLLDVSSHVCLVTWVRTGDVEMRSKRNGV
jgi:hypothetical protein